MIYFPFTKASGSYEALIAPGATISAQGQALVRTAGITAEGVSPSTGTATDIFVGFSCAQTSAAPFAEGYAAKVEQFTVGSTGAVSLSMTPVTGQVFVYDVTTSTAVATPTVTGNQVTGLTAGDQVRVTYRYALSVVQSRAMYGDVIPGGFVGAYVGQIGVISSGTIFTDQFDASQDWATASAKATTQIILGANGQLTIGSAVSTPAYPVTTLFPGTVIAIPTQDQPFLGVRFSAA